MIMPAATEDDWAVIAPADGTGGAGAWPVTARR